MNVKEFLKECKRLEENLKEEKDCEYRIYLNGEWYYTAHSEDEANRIESELYSASNTEDDFQSYYGSYPDIEIKKVCRENLEEGWILFQFEDGSNPYIAKTKKEQDRMLKKYDDRLKQLSDTTYLVKSEKKLKEGLYEFSKPDKKAIIQWWKDVSEIEDNYVDISNIDQALEDDDYLFSWFSAMYDVLNDLRYNFIEKDDDKREYITNLYRKGKRLYNKYALSQFNENLKESQAQEIGQEYRRLSNKYGVDFDDLVYGKDGFMKSMYPDNPNYVYFPDFNGDVIFSEKHWNELVDWAEKNKGIKLDKWGDIKYKDEFDDFLNESLNSNDNVKQIVNIIKDKLSKSSYLTYEEDEIYSDNSARIRYYFNDTLINQANDKMKDVLNRTLIDITIKDYSEDTFVNDDAPEIEINIYSVFDMFKDDWCESLSLNNVNENEIIDYLEENLGDEALLDNAINNNTWEESLKEDNSLSNKLNTLLPKIEEDLDTTQNLINSAKKFAKDSDIDVKVTGIVNSGEVSISTFPEDFNEMVELFNTQFEVYDQDEELEKFKIKCKELV